MRAFVALAKTGNFTTAAQTLHVTQSALSGLIKELEQTLGARVVDRSTRRIVLTEIGRELFPLFSQMIDDLDGALANVADHTQLRKGVVRLAAPQLMCCTLVPQALAAYRADPSGHRCPGRRQRRRERDRARAVGRIGFRHRPRTREHAATGSARAVRDAVFAGVPARSSAGSERARHLAGRGPLSLHRAAGTIYRAPAGRHAGPAARSPAQTRQRSRLHDDRAGDGQRRARHHGLPAVCRAAGAPAPAAHARARGTAADAPLLRLHARRPLAVAGGGKLHRLPVPLRARPSATACASSRAR